MFVFNLEAILLNKERNIDELIVQEMKKINERNHLIAITSNKTYKESLKYIEHVKKFINFFIGNNGAILVDNIKNELLKTPQTINHEFINNILRDVELLSGAVQIITSKKKYVRSYINFLKSDEWLSESAKNENILSFSKYRNEINFNNNEVIQLTIIINPDFINEFLIYLHKFYQSNYEFKLSSEISLDINVAGVNKFEGIKTIMMLYKISLENVFCFGDTENDVELMRNIKNTYTKNNSMPIIKELAQNIIDLNNTNTFSFEIQKILKNK